MPPTDRRLGLLRRKAPEIVKIATRVRVRGILAQSAEEPEVAAGVYPRDCAYTRRRQIRRGGSAQGAVSAYPVADLGTADPGPVSAVEFPEIVQKA